MGNPFSDALPRAVRTGRPPRRLALRLAGFGALWWALTGGEPPSWLVGLPTVAAAAVLSLILAPERSVRWRVLGILQFVPFFLWQSLRGGADVAARALHPARPLAPEVFFHPWRLPPGTPRVLFANVVSLLPGTLSTRLGHDGLTLHVLDRDRPLEEQLTDLETRVADLFGTSRVSRQSPKGPS